MQHQKVIGPLESGLEPDGAAAHPAALRATTIIEFEGKYLLDVIRLHIPMAENTHYTARDQPYPFGLVEKPCCRIIHEIAPFSKSLPVQAPQ
jgi:hypothetical protein